MTSQSRAVVAVAPGKLEIQTFPLPNIGPSDGILKIELAGVCGSDPGIFNGKTSRAPRPYPIILGHEIVGRIHEMGDEACKRHGVAIGDRVIIEYAFGCGTCQMCLEGRYTICRNFRNYGSMISCAPPPHLYGAYADYLYIPERAMVHKIGDDISPETGVLISAVLGNGIRWLRQIGGVSLGQTVAVIGPGQQGLAAVAVAKESGAEPIIVVGLEQDRERLETALRFGADIVINADQEDPVERVSKETLGNMANLVMDVTGHPSGAKTAVSLAGSGATIVLPGLYGGEKEIPLLLDRIVFNEITLKGVFSHDFKAVKPAIKMAARGRYPFGDLVSHRLPLDKAEYALGLVAGDYRGENVMKVVLDPAMSHV